MNKGEKYTYDKEIEKWTTEETKEEGFFFDFTSEWPDEEIEGGK